MAAAQLAPIFAALVPITVLQLVLIHIDHEVPPRCVNLLDINISAHAPRMRIPLRAGQRAAGPFALTRFPPVLPRAAPRPLGAPRR